jgi:predicted metal-binding membrane protein
MERPEGAVQAPVGASADAKSASAAKAPDAVRPSRLETVLRHDRIVAVLALLAVAGLAWSYTLAGGGLGMTAFDMTAMLESMPDMAMPPTQWSPSYGLLVFLMWWIMMIAMMVPGAAPMLLLYAAIIRKRRAQTPPYAAASLFLAGYLAMWAVFSGVAAALHWGFDSTGLLTPMMASSSTLFSGVLLIGAGLYQLSPLKNACLGQCRQPVAFITSHWRSGMLGAFRMGAAHGVYCLGCCWLLMALLFFGGVMHVYWIAGIATYVLVEKLLRGRWLTNASGAALMSAGVWVLVQAR